ncbi:hypothetical protein G3M48_006220 [Beauveria asiatica]|uniref:Uncharacterized protein n=1 Tax=Beauveria asiatica TaxID=1069075 RepID=A0AAW0S5I3_9HYPO
MLLRSGAAPVGAHAPDLPNREGRRETATFFMNNLEGNKNKTLIEFLVGYQDSNSDDEVLDLLLNESSRVEIKLQELFEPSHASKIIDIAPLVLEGDRLAQWRKAVLSAPSPIIHKYKNNLRLSDSDFSDLGKLTDVLAAVMDYDKHCNLQMILYDDGREEIRKPGRKLIGEMKKEEIKDRVRPWIAESQPWAFSGVDLIEPKTLTVMCDAIAALGRNLAEASPITTQTTAI